MAGLLGGLCFFDGCCEAPATADDAFCSAHWRRLPHATRTEIVKLRNEGERGASTSKAYVMRLIQATKELREMPAPV